MRAEGARVGQLVERVARHPYVVARLAGSANALCQCGQMVEVGDLCAEQVQTEGAATWRYVACLHCVEPVECGDYRQARGAVPWAPGDELPEAAIRRALRDAGPPCRVEVGCAAGTTIEIEPGQCAVSDGGDRGQRAIPPFGQQEEAIRWLRRDEGDLAGAGQCLAEQRACGHWVPVHFSFCPVCAPTGRAEYWRVEHDRIVGVFEADHHEQCAARRRAEREARRWRGRALALLASVRRERRRKRLALSLMHGWAAKARALEEQSAAEGGPGRGRDSHEPTEI